MVSIFAQWDPMITTLPGLYLVSVGVIKPVVWLADLTGAVVCSTAMLRFINLLFNCGNLYLLYLLVCKLHLREKVFPDAGDDLARFGLSVSCPLTSRFLSSRHEQPHGESSQRSLCPPSLCSTSSTSSTTPMPDLLSSSSSPTS